LEPEELATWIKEGVQLTPVQRRTFSKSSSEKTCLIRFLASIEDCIRDKLRASKGVLNDNNGTNDIPDHVYAAVSKIFKQFDDDGSGCIDQDELKSMILQLNNNDNATTTTTPGMLETATTFVMETLCGNSEDVLLTLNAFACWVAEGIKLTPTERKLFAKSGSNKAVLIRFLRTIEDEIEYPGTTTAGEGEGGEGKGSGGSGSSYDSQLKRSIQDVFKQYDTDGSGAIDLEELSAMITEIQIEEGVPSNLINHTQSKKAAETVMKILVGNKNNSEEYMLTLPQFRDWLLKGIKMTALQRKSFAKVNQSNMILARFLRAVERLARQYTDDTPISRAVRSVFVKYDVDGSGLIEENELARLIVDLVTDDGGTIGVKAANDASRQMMKMLVNNTVEVGDSGGNNNSKKLSEEAFLGWVHKGSQMPGHKRRQFAKGREDRRAMILLLRTVEVIARTEQWTPRKLILHKMFQQYDQDGSGHIDTPELSSMMCDLVPSMDSAAATECALAVVKHLDSSGNNLLEEEEFFNWLNNGMKMRESDRIQLKQGGPSKMNLVIFLEAVEQLLLKKEAQAGEGN
jgi:Ca2+-binding EF-hand superfamily protein